MYTSGNFLLQPGSFSRTYSHSIGLLCIVLLTNLALLPAAFGAVVYINELHYDNVGSDTGEGIEVAGTAGFDLHDWQLLFYNGNDGSIYKSLTLSGVIDDEAGGFGALGFSTSGIQNGPADGIALLSNLGNVLEFISYEGSLTATEGTALGMTSIDIGISQGASTTAGFSLQRTGTGFSSEDFSWTTGPSNFGTLNSGQTIIATPVPLPGGLLLLSSSLLGFWGALFGARPRSNTLPAC